MITRFLNKNSGNISTKAVITAIFAAALYGLSAPFAKLLLEFIPPAMMAAFLYLGAGIGMLLLDFSLHFVGKSTNEARLKKHDWPYVAAMILLDILAPVLLMVGLTYTSAENVSLLSNFEIVATSIIAMIVFREFISKRMWYAIGLICAASILLTVSNIGNFKLTSGSLLVIAACIVWGFENNFTRKISSKDPLQIVIIKGFGSGIGAFIISMALGERCDYYLYIALSLLLGFFAYGLSILLYVKAQRDLGAARTSAYYAAAPFIGVILSWVILREAITGFFIVALAIMLFGAYLAMTENHGHSHRHLPVTHEHKHSHQDMHHNHQHSDNSQDDHSHIHTHEDLAHTHRHLPDTHHNHTHGKHLK